MTCKYGNPESVKQDSRTLADIISRQGTSLVIDALSESVGKSALKFNLNDPELKRLRETLINELREALLERT